jgi:hypothetical protein
MKFGMDFSLIIAVLVLIQLYILNMKVSDKLSDKSEVLLTEKIEKPEEVAIATVATAATEKAENDLYFVVHRSNGEEKVYSKQDVA